MFNSLEWGLISPPKPHAFTSLPVQSDCIDIVSLINNFPVEIKNSILGHLGASHTDIHNQIDVVLRGLSRLDMTHLIYSEILPHEDPIRHLSTYDSVSKEISKLIHVRSLYESITKDYSHINSCIESLDHGFD